METEVVVFILG